MAFTEPRRVFMDARHFATAATVGASTVYGHFDDDYAEFADIEGSAPAFHCLDADLPAGTAHGDTLVHASKTYTIRGIQPDGTGFTTLRLEYVSG